MEQHVGDNILLQSCVQCVEMSCESLSIEGFSCFFPTPCRIRRPNHPNLFQKRLRLPSAGRERAGTGKGREGRVGGPS